MSGRRAGLWILAIVAVGAGLGVYLQGLNHRSQDDPRKQDAAIEGSGAPPAVAPPPANGAGGAPQAGAPPPAPPAAKDPRLEGPWRIHGAVTTNEPGGALKGATVAFTLRRGVRRERIGQADVGADGRYTALLPRIDGLSREALHVATLGVRASGPQLVARETVLDIDPEVSDGAHELVADFMLPAGNFAHGRVVDVDGRPVPGARVALYIQSDDTPATAACDASGGYAVQIPAGGPGFLIASAPDVGTGWINPHVWNLGKDDVLPAIMLRGEGTVAGVVVWPDGSPVSGLALSIRPSKPPGGGPRGRLETPPGNDDATATTDAAGKFQAKGLMPGDLRVTAGFHEFVVPNGTTDARWVFEDHLVLVRLADTKGEPATAGTEVGVTEFGKVKEILRVGGDEGGIEALFAVRNPGDYHLKITAPWCLDIDRTLDVRAAMMTRVEAVLMSTARPERVVFDVHDEMGSVVPFVVVRVEDAYRPDLPARWTRDEGQPLMHMPPGAYTVEVQPLLKGEQEATTYTKAERVNIVVTGGHESRAEVRVTRGARVNIRLAFPEGATSAEFVGADVITADGSNGSPIVRWGLNGEAGAARGGHLVLEKGVVFSPSAPLAPGHWRIRLAFNFFLPTDIDVDLEAGKTTEVSATLKRPGGD